ncbi:MAG: hypothetical protein LBM04_04490, partial [Opitutaceae bacterium]|nr:hypothetical protein [Opitutaceae bacterium]
GGYFAKLPLPSEEPLPKISSYPVSAPAQFPIFVNRIAVSDDKIHGELMLTTTRLFDAANIQKTKSDGEIEAIPIAILHSKVGLHARFLTDLLGSI